MTSSLILPLILPSLLCMPQPPQGNMDPGVLFGSKDAIEARVMDTIRRARSQGVRHIMNLGHGVLPGTPEENVAHYFEVARTAHERL